MSYDAWKTDAEYDDEKSDRHRRRPSEEELEAMEGEIETEWDGDEEESDS